MLLPKAQRQFRDVRRRLFNTLEDVNPAFLQYIHRMSLFLNQNRALAVTPNVLGGASI
jgi:hypothetical protein